MMSSEEFSSTEELYYEGSHVEPLYDYNQGSQMRFSESVVYVPHVLWPVMLLEYIPVFYNFQTYEPYLINRYEIMYVPFIRQASVTSFVPYYYQNTTAYTTPEVFSSNTRAVYSNYTQNEADTNSSSQESILDEVSSDELEYEDDINSNISYYGDTSILSLSSSDSSSTYEHSELNSTQEPSVSLQGLVSTENDDCFNLRNEDENNSARDYPEGLISASIEGDGCSLSLLLGNDDKGPAELDCPEEYLDHIPFDEKREGECDVSSISSLVDVETPESLTESDTSILSLSYSDSSSSYEHSVFNSTQEPSESLQGSIFTENNDCFDSRIDDEHKTAWEYPEGLIIAADEDVIIEGEGCSLPLMLEKDYKGPPELDCPVGYLDHIPFDKEREVEYDVSSISSFVDVETPESLTESVKVEASSFKDRNLSPERRENHAVFDNDIETRISNASSLEYVDKCRYENGLEHQEWLSLINEKNTRYDSDTSSSNMLMWGHEKPLQKQDSQHETDVKVPEPFDYVMSESENDTHDDPEITLEDVLASEEYWRVKREEYSRKIRKTELYKSALQGDIRPTKSLPDVGTMDTIFEDLPYPVNEPYDDGQESKDVDFDLAPLAVQRSMSSTTTLLPASSDEALNSYHQESQMRYYENVVYVPHVFSPVMLVEYVPVFYNYLTYEPYLMNRYQVTYVPFIQQVSYSYFVPYYYSYSPPEVFSSYTPEVFPQNEAETDSNSYPESSLGDESTSDDLSSSISYSDETSVVSLSSSYSYNSNEVSDFSSTQEPSESLEGSVCKENDYSLDLNSVDELNITREYTEGFFSSIDADIGIEANASNSSLLLLDEENSPAALDRSGNSLDRISLHEDLLVVSDVSSIPLLVDVEKLEVLRGSDIDEKSSLIDIGKDEYERDFSPQRCDNYVVFDDSIALKSPVSNLPLRDYDKKSDDEINFQQSDLWPLKDTDFSPERCGNVVVFDDSISSKSRVSDLPLHGYVKKSYDKNNLQQSELSPLKDIEKDEYDRHFSPERCENRVVFDHSIALKSPVSDLPLHDYIKKSEGEKMLQQSELLPLKDIENDEYERHFSPERCGNLVVFYDDIASKSRVSGLPSHDYVIKSGDENKLQQNELSLLKNENVNM